MADGLTGPVSQSSPVKTTLSLGYHYVIRYRRRRARSLIYVAILYRPKVKPIKAKAYTLSRTATEKPHRLFAPLLEAVRKRPLSANTGRGGNLPLTDGAGPGNRTKLVSVIKPKRAPFLCRINRVRPIAV
ncbi:hypothetical protein ElyMa_006089300 [Elysia marginata]|uniref:Uncharacterized protein n=1 Tax=Elysia marginata TaxID=1093978 RepID=A0AAV4GQU1_9GAST|nr:hypothetical protein ElyMa_006089300 [Elysia marginata]